MGLLLVSDPLTFILTGIPGLPMSSYWMALPLCCLYLLMLLGNCTLLWMIKTDHSLHTPMYYFLSMLAMADLGLSLTTLPTMLAVFCFKSTSFYFEACIVQMYFIHSFSEIESGVLVAMAFDRFMAICYPLRYASVLTSTLIMKAGAAIFVRGICVVLPVAVLIKKMPFCRSRVLSHSFCLHQDLLRLVCGDVRVNSVYGLTMVMLTKGAILSIISQEARAKAFSTCISHLCAILIFYIPLLGLSVMHRFGKAPAPPHSRTHGRCLSPGAAGPEPPRVQLENQADPQEDPHPPLSEKEPAACLALERHRAQVSLPLPFLST
uniref:G-protein coupled receptors family 1 profile domain-containing protein n=1 Tax=Anas platyrhynchos TaxID=8839 RepID=A0A8B9ZF15_ANAPL